MKARIADPRRKRAERAGRRAETVALWYLRLKLYRLLARRYRTPAGEIDLFTHAAPTDPCQPTDPCRDRWIVAGIVANNGVRYRASVSGLTATFTPR